MIAPSIPAALQRRNIRIAGYAAAGRDLAGYRLPKLPESYEIRPGQCAVGGNVGVDDGLNPHGLHACCAKSKSFEAAVLDPIRRVFTMPSMASMPTAIFVPVDFRQLPSRTSGLDTAAEPMTHRLTPSANTACQVLHGAACRRPVLPSCRTSGRLHGQSRRCLARRRLAPSRSTMWIHSAPAARNANAVATGSSAT